MARLSARQRCEKKDLRGRGRLPGCFFMANMPVTITNQRAGQSLALPDAAAARQGRARGLTLSARGFSPAGCARACGSGKAKRRSRLRGPGRGSFPAPLAGRRFFAPSERFTAISIRDAPMLTVLSLPRFITLSGGKARFFAESTLPRSRRTCVGGAFC